MIILNSSPVIHLTVALGRLDALPALYDRVLVPEPVLRELEAGAELDEAARRLRTVPGIAVCPGNRGFAAPGRRAGSRRGGGDPTRTGPFGRYRGAGRPQGEARNPFTHRPSP